jgi:hypothetical protein
MVRLLIVVAGLLLAGPALGQDPYGAAFAKAGILEQQGHPGEAAALLEPLVEAYPQDFALFLRLGWLHFSAAEYLEALPHYETAAALVPDSVEARLGIAWTQVRLGRCGKARPHFLKAQSLAPKSASAQEGLALCGPPASFHPSLLGTYHSYTTHPFKKSAYSGTISLPTVLLDLLVLAPTYRYTQFKTRPQPGLGASRGGSSFAQHEGYLAAGLKFRAVTVLGHYALVHDGSLDQYARVAGLSAAGVPGFGHYYLEASLGQHQDTNALRLAARYTIPLSSRFFLVPALAGQSVNDETFYSLGGSLQVQATRALALVLGGKWGEERLPAYLDQPSVYNIPERILWGAWAEADWTIAQWVLRLAAEYYRLEALTPTGFSQPSMALFSLGFVL